ncbi:hypothetical protein N8079_01755 [Crocinitomicaceae bacterium]|jgi:hypothetical protein|nr:hypothetical protein [Crocinitomicaceae bacterium]MDG2464741.1 hypothetical protein [Crocinitomicaceae bacterium]
MGERKLFQSVFLTLIAYGFVSFFQSGVFLVPLPAFEIVILGIALYFGVKHLRMNKFASILFVLFGIFQFFGRIYNYNFFLSDDSMYELSQTFWVDGFYLFSGVLLGFLFFFQHKTSFGIVLKTLISLTLVVGLALPYQWVSILPLALIFVLYFKKDILFKNQHSFWLYLLAFAVSRELTLYLL